MQQELEAFVPVRLNAEGDGAEAAERYSVSGFPTTVFLTGAGDEVDRIVGYLPPEEFIGELRRIRSGDTFAACIRQLDLDPGDPENLKRAAQGYLDRSEPLEVIRRIDAFHREAGEGAVDPCSTLMLEARAALGRRLYREAVSAVLWNEGEAPDVPREAGLPHLEDLLADEGLAEQEAEVAASRLREARHRDVGGLLTNVAVDELDEAGLRAVADVAFSGGHYDRASELWVRWYRQAGEPHSAGLLNEVSWNLYLARRELDTAVEMAREAYAADDSPSVGDTLGRLLYVTGSTEEAIEIQSRAAEQAEGRLADDLEEAAELMRSGAELQDTPGFESFPRLPEPSGEEEAAD